MLDTYRVMRKVFILSFLEYMLLYGISVIMAIDQGLRNNLLNFKVL